MNSNKLGRYPGARPFADDPNDQKLFFGRDQEIDQLFHRIAASRLLVLFGKSGLGKTSLLQAGVYPKLRDRDMLPIPVRLNSPELPLDAIKASVTALSEKFQLDYTPGIGASLWEYFKTLQLWQGERLLTPVLVIDQFEEIFTLKTPAERQDWASQLGDLLRETLPLALRKTSTLSASLPAVRLVFSLREDFLGALQELADLIPGIFDDRVRLSPLTDSQAESAICLPASLNQPDIYSTPPFSYESATLNAIIQFLRGKSAAIEPFQLQLVCCAIEAQVLASVAQNKTLSLVTEADLGGQKRLDAIVKNFYQQTLKTLSGRQRRCAQRLCEEGLLNASGFRLSLQENQILEDYKLSPASLSALVQARLLRKEPRLESYFYELSHDSLARPILDSRPWRLTRRQRNGLLGFLLLGGIVAAFAVLQSQAKQEALAAEAKAQLAREEAEKILDYLVFDLRDKLEPIGRLDIVKEVQQQVNGYYEKMGTQGQSAVVLNRRSAAYCNVGDRLFAQGDLVNALEAYQQGLKIARQLVALEPLDRGVQRALAVALDRLGDVLLEQGKLEAARTNYQESLVIRQKLVALNLGNSVWQRGISVSLNNLGDVLLKQGKLEAAQSDYQEGLVILQKLATLDPNNSGLQRDVSVTLERLADVLVKQGKLEAALKYYVDDLAITKKLTTLDPNNSGWQRDVSVALEKSADVLVKQGKLEAALKYYVEVLAITKNLAALDPSNSGWQRDVSVVLERLADVLFKQGKLEAALKYYVQDLAITKKLAALDPSNSGWQGDLSISYEKLASFFKMKKDVIKADEYYQKALLIREQLASLDTNNVVWQNHLTWLYKFYGSFLYDNKHADQAVELTKRRIAYRLKLPDSPENKQALANAYLSLAWYELFNHQPNNAIAASQQGLQLNVSEVTNNILTTNLAHGYLFAGQFQQAKALYQQNASKKLPDGRTFKQAVLTDFSDFRNHGINTKDMKKIEALLR